MWLRTRLFLGSSKTFQNIRIWMIWMINSTQGKINSIPLSTLLETGASTIQIITIITNQAKGNIAKTMVMMVLRMTGPSKKTRAFSKWCLAGRLSNRRGKEPEAQTTQINSILTVDNSKRVDLEEQGLKIWGRDSKALKTINSFLRPEIIILEKEGNRLSFCPRVAINRVSKGANFLRIRTLTPSIEIKENFKTAQDLLHQCKEGVTITIIIKQTKMEIEVAARTPLTDTLLEGLKKESLSKTIQDWASTLLPGRTLDPDQDKIIEIKMIWCLLVHRADSLGDKRLLGKMVIISQCKTKIMCKRTDNHPLMDSADGRILSRTFSTWDNHHQGKTEQDLDWWTKL